MTLSFTVGQMTVFCALYFNGHILCLQNLDTSMCIAGYSGVHSLAKWSHGPYHLQNHLSALAIGLQHSWKHSSWLQASWDRHPPLVAIRSSDGDVSRGNPRLHHHANWQVVKQQSRRSTSQATSQEDAELLLLVIPSYPGHRSSTDLLRRPPAEQPS